MMPIRYRRRSSHASFRPFTRRTPNSSESGFALDEHNGRDKMIPVTHRKMKPSPYTRRFAALPRDKAPISSGVKP